MSRVADFLKGLVALLVILGLLVGVPVALVAFAGNPLDDAQRLLGNELLSDDTTASLALRAGLTVLVWLTWFQIAFSILFEFIALARGRTAGRASLVPGVQSVARHLVIASTLLVNAFTSTAGATALMPLAVPPPVTSVEVDLLQPPDLEVPSSPVVVAAPAATYTAVAGDTFWSLAESMLGDGLRWSEIREANLGRTMADGTVISEVTEVVRDGWELVLPVDAVLPLRSGPAVVVVDDALPDQLALVTEDAANPDLLGVWNVAQGDHFWAIAEETLTAAYGRPVTDEEITPYWLEIVEANRGRLVTGDPDLVQPGQTFDVLLPPLTDELVIDFAPANGDHAPGHPATGAETAHEAVTEGLTDHLAARPVTAEPEWQATESADSRGTLKPFEPAEATAGLVDGRDVALGLFGTAVGAGALMQLLRRRRQTEADGAESGAIVSAAPSGAEAFEARIRPIANTDAVRWLAATNRYLTRQLALVGPAEPLPAVLAMRAGEFGIEVLLDEASQPPDGFVADGSTGAAWRLRADVEIDTVETASRGVDAFSPALLPVGETDAGDLLVDFEQLAVMSLVGDIATIAGWMATIATSATAMGWSQSCPVVAIGVQTVLGGSNQVRVPTDVEAWAEETIAAHTISSRSADTSTYRRRLDAVDASFASHSTEGPTIVLLGPGHDDLARRLAAVAELAYSSLVLVTTTVLDGHARIELQPDHGVVIPDDSGLRLEFDPILTGAATARYAAELVGVGDDRRHADVYDTVRRRPLDPADDSDDPVPHHLWPPPSPASARSSSAPVPVSIDLAPAEQSLHPAAPADADDNLQPSWPSPAPRLDHHPILEPRPIEASVLAARPSVAGLNTSPPETEEILAYLATARSATPADLASLFFPDLSMDEMAEQLVDVVTGLDAAAGRSSDGRCRVWFDEPSGRCWVSDEVASDYNRIEALAALAGQTASLSDEQALLEVSLGLIDGVPGLEAPSDRFRWLRTGQPTRSAIDALVVETALRLAEVALVGEGADVASWAAGQGLLVVPGHEALHRVQMKAAAARYDRQGIEDAYRAAVEAMEESSPWDGLQPETDRLYRQLVSPLGERT